MTIPENGPGSLAPGAVVAAGPLEGAAVEPAATTPDRQRTPLTPRQHHAWLKKLSEYLSGSTLRRCRPGEWVPNPTYYRAGNDAWFLLEVRLAGGQVVRVVSECSYSVSWPEGRLYKQMFCLLREKDSVLLSFGDPVEAVHALPEKARQS